MSLTYRLFGRPRSVADALCELEEHPADTSVSVHPVVQVRSRQPFAITQYCAEVTVYHNGHRDRFETVLAAYTQRDGPARRAFERHRAELRLEDLSAAFRRRSDQVAIASRPSQQSLQEHSS